MTFQEITKAEFLYGSALVLCLNQTFPVFDVCVYSRKLKSSFTVNSTGLEPSLNILAVLDPISFI